MNKATLTMPPQLESNSVPHVDPGKAKLDAGWMVIVVGAAIATAWLVFASVRIEMSYLNNYGFFFDPAAYQLDNLMLYKYFEEKGTYAALAQELTHNCRYPLRTIPLLLLQPKLLTELTGHIWTAAPFIWLFLAMLGTTILSRTKSLSLSIAAVGLFVGLPFLYDPKLGVAAYWLDLTAACAMGSAAICLVRYVRAPSISWMIAFGALASATALCRWSTAFYLISFAALALPIAVFTATGLSAKQRWQSVAAVALGAIPGIAFTIYFFAQNSQYYKTYDYAFGASMSSSISWTMSALKSMFGEPTLFALLALVALNLVSLLIRRADWRAPLISLWLPASVFTFVCLVVRAVDGYHPLSQFAPALFVAAFCPITDVVQHQWRWRAAIAALLALAVGTTVNSYDSMRRLANNPPPEVAAQKRTDAEIAKYIAATNSVSVAELDAESMMPQLEAFFNHRVFCRHLAYFSVHESYLKGRYPKKSPQEMADFAYFRAGHEAGLLVVLADAQDASKPGMFDNPYSVTMAKTFSYKAQHDPVWQFRGNVQSPKALLSIYENTRRQEIKDVWAIAGFKKE